ncbi:hypothetical protein B0T25DRAFT_567237 [Lasiosphaeria hispida]|uniref:Uncharacterized protein n=1 Tax=Lasiosphaeria hispida TaxID=260671 RepID=A0AAJ0HNH7_9PEZI|nr:hypothetical protein B0T25DRAFT_567237 [Lasiosphaeria hispida]
MEEPDKRLTGDGQILAVPPPVDAHGLRALVLARLEQYLRHLRLQAAGAHDNGSLDVINPTNHNAICFRVTQVALLRDWSGYPIAFYSIATWERRMTDTASLREGLAAIALAVEKGIPVKNATCLSAESWKAIPWELLKR